MPTAYEIEREANIKRNRALLDELDLKQAVSSLGISKEKPTPTAKPVQPAKKKVKREADVVPIRKSARLRGTNIDPKETPEMKRKRIAEEQEQKAKEAEERLEAEERERIAKRPRHHDLDLATLSENLEPREFEKLCETLQIVSSKSYAKGVGDHDAFVYESDEGDEAEVKELREKLSKLKVVSRAKVTQDRVYSAAYHPEVTKDLIFFGDKHGQLGIWDAQAPAEVVEDEEDEVVASVEGSEGGKCWKLQLHWPATSRSTISSIKFDPIDSHTIYTSSYDCTIRSLSLGSGISREIFSIEDTMISSLDLSPQGHEMWISDALGGVTHFDLREDKKKAKRHWFSNEKIGNVSVNPTRPQFLLTASNNRTLRVWDTRKLAAIDKASDPTSPSSSPTRKRQASSSTTADPSVFDYETTQAFYKSKQGHGLLRAEWSHDKSVSSAYWDPRGRSIVSTSYDDNIRIWDINSSAFKGDGPFKSSRPFCKIRHNCQTGKWVTILKAQWTQNANVYPHFTIGNMKHSLDIISCKGDLLAQLKDRNITAVQAVTCSHPNIVERAASGNASGRCFLWAPLEQ